ncbi:MULTISPECIES: hypothetical protein [Cupriavidus]
MLDASGSMTKRFAVRPRLIPLCFVLGLGGCNQWDEILARKTAEPESELPAGIADGVPVRFRGDGMPAVFTLLGPAGVTEATLTAFRQDAGGAMTGLGGFALAGATTQVSEVSGGADFALGRWTAGTVTGPQGHSEVLDGGARGSWHYLAIKPLQGLPANWTYRCGTPRATAMTFVNGINIDNNAQSGVIGGSAKLSFANGTGTLDFRLAGRARVSRGELKGTLALTAAMARHGDFDVGGPGARIWLGWAGRGAILIAMPYRLRLGNGALFQGGVVFRCEA